MTDGLTDERTENWLTDWLIDWKRDFCLTDRLIDWLVNWLTDWLTAAWRRLMGWLTEWHFNNYVTNFLSPWLLFRSFPLTIVFLEKRCHQYLIKIRFLNEPNSGLRAIGPILSSAVEKKHVKLQKYRQTYLRNILEMVFEWQ